MWSFAFSGGEWSSGHLGKIGGGLQDPFTARDNAQAIQYLRNKSQGK